jgi:hypothetical protein
MITARQSNLPRVNNAASDLAHTATAILRGSPTITQSVDVAVWA